MNETINQEEKQIVKKRLSDIVGKEVDEFIISKDYFELVFKGGPVLKLSIGGRPKSDQKWEEGLDIKLNGELILKTYDNVRTREVI